MCHCLLGACYLGGQRLVRGIPKLSCCDGFYKGEASGGAGKVFPRKVTFKQVFRDWTGIHLAKKKKGGTVQVEGTACAKPEKEEEWVADGRPRCWEGGGEWSWKMLGRWAQLTTQGLVSPTKYSSAHPKSRMKPLKMLNQICISGIPLAACEQWIELGEEVRRAGRGTNNMPEWELNICKLNNWKIYELSNEQN